MTDIETRYQRLVEEAYSAAASDTGYSDVLEQTHRYLFSDEAKLHADLPRNRSRDIALEMHLPQLKQLFERRANLAQSGDQPYALLSIRQRDGIVAGNTSAEGLLNCKFPCSIESLPLDHSSLRRLRSVVNRPTKSIELLLMRIGEENPRSCLVMVQEAQPGISEVAISYLNWTPELRDTVCRALGLSDRETQVFGELVQNKSFNEIAQALNRSPETVRSQSKNILRKTGCTKMSEVVQIASGLAYLLEQQPPQIASPEDTLIWKTPINRMATLPRPNGRTLAYYTRGKGRRRILFMHGFLQGPFFTPAFEKALSLADIQLICPSRPGFGYTSKSSSRSNYELTTIEDAIALLDQLEIEETILVCHQLSTNHAFRLKAKIPQRIKAMVMISASPPIDEAYIKQMDTPTKIAAATAKYTPSVLKLINEIGIHSHRRGGGPRAFLQSRYKNSEMDLSTLDDPVLCKQQINGVFHYIEQGSETLVRDAVSSMKDWGDLFVGDACPQRWLHGAQCKALNVEVVREIVQSRIQARYDIVPDASTNLIHQKPELVVSAIKTSLQSVRTS